MFVVGVLFAACKGGKRYNPEDNNPILQDPAIKGYTDKIAKDTGNARLYFERGKALHHIEQDSLAINEALLARHPDGIIYGLRIGYKAMYSFGGAMTPDD